MMRYWPVPSVTADRVFSISAGLDASTVTPGRTAPDESRTVPVTDACAKRGAGISRTARIVRPFVALRMKHVLLPDGHETTRTLDRRPRLDARCRVDHAIRQRRRRIRTPSLRCQGF